MSVYAMGPPTHLERFSQKVSELADDAATEGQHADDEDDALNDRDPRAKLGQVVLERHHDEGADYRAEHRAEAAEQRHEHHLAGHRPVHVGERRKLEDQGFRRAREARERRRKYEGKKLVLLGAVPERDRSWFVLPDGLQDLAERRVDRAEDREESEQEDREHDEVERERLPEIERPEERSARDRLDAVLAAREDRLQAEKIGHLRERQRDVREVDALAPDRQRADDDAERGRGGGPEDDRQLRRKSPDLRGVRRPVTGRAEKDGVAEGEEPDVPDEEVEGACEQRKAQRLHEEHRVHEERRRHEGRRHDQKGDDVRRRHPGDRGQDRADVLVARRSHEARPKRPAGRSSSTTAMITKITVLEDS